MSYLEYVPKGKYVEPSTAKIESKYGGDCPGFVLLVTDHECQAVRIHLTPNEANNVRQHLNLWLDWFEAEIETQKRQLKDEL